MSRSRAWPREPRGWSLPPAPAGSGLTEQLSDLIRIVRRLDLEADLEGPVPDALQAQMRVEDFEQLDLAYSPPFATVWDPLLIAARQLQKEL